MDAENLLEKRMFLMATITYTDVSAGTAPASGVAP
jgi:hypothetical protein